MFSILSYNLTIALEAIIQNRLRAFLTSLGIIFGVASVIAMLAIGSGAQQQILEQMKVLGTNNIIIQPVIEQEEGTLEEDASSTTNNKRFSPGLTLEDLAAIESVIPTISETSPEILSDVLVIRNGFKRSGKLVGVASEYFTISNGPLEQGRYFSEVQQSFAHPVCIIGKSVKTRFFAGENPIGKKIKCGPIWFTVIGVLAPRNSSGEALQSLGIRDYDSDIYIPATTFLLRHKNRSMVTALDIKQANSNQDEDEENTKPFSKNYHQIDRMIVQVSSSDRITATAEVIARMLERRHNNIVDFEIIIPEVLLQQEQRTKRIFNVVLSSIASISLIVGGIGIMNIMFASVVERYKEIGTRMAIGARKLDIKLQFVTESLVISLSGGLIGIILGVTFSYVIEEMTDIQTLVTAFSIVVSFGVSLSVGLIFGIFPAIKAAEQEPADVLRYE